MLDVDDSEKLTGSPELPTSSDADAMKAHAL
jgi:hypothetical protein